MSLIMELRAGSTSCHRVALGSRPAPPRCPRPCFRRGMLVRAYDIDVEPAPPRAPESSPGRWGSSPPPPPPPPLPRKASAFQAPSRREALFAVLGAVGGGAVAALFFNTQYDLGDESATEALDEILDDPEFLDAISDEVLFREYETNLDKAEDGVDSLGELDDELAKLSAEVEKAERAAAEEKQGN